MWNKQLKQHWNRAKSFIHQGYSHLGGWAKEFNKAAGIGKRIFSLATPMLEDIGQGNVVRHGAEVIGQYENLKSRAQEVDTRIRGHASRFDNANIFD